VEKQSLFSHQLLWPGQSCESAEVADHRYHATARDSMWGPTFPELVDALPGIEIIDRSASWTPAHATGGCYCVGLRNLDGGNS
jgi:hypothetical protein